MTHRQLFQANLAQTSDAPLSLEIERAEGIWLYDKNNNAYLDLISGIAVSNLGHRHPKVESAVKEQLNLYWHTMVYGEYILAPQVKLASLLTSHLPSSLSSVYFVNSGSEATEGAMKLAKRYTGRPEIISCRNAYHGSTQGAASLMSPEDFTRPYHPLLPGITHIDFNDEKMLRRITDRTAAVIIEPVQAEAGVRIPMGNYLSKLRSRCDETGALLIFDEAQTAFGRTGSLFAFEQYDVVPDILLLAKAFGGGMPLGAFIASGEIMNALSNNPPLGHITTFGGHPVACAAALASLQVLLEEEWIPQVKGKESLFKELLRHKAIKEVRTAGLMIAVEFSGFEEVMKVVEKCLKKGLIVDWFLFNDKSLRLAPPLIISEEEIMKACALLLEAIDEAIKDADE